MEEQEAAPAAKNPAFEAEVRASFGRQPFMAYLGATLAKVAPGQVHIALPFRAECTQQNGFMHAGAITSVADSACGYAAFTLCPPEHDVLAVEFKISLLAPARAPAFLACARVLRAGRTLTTAQADVFGLHDGKRELVATMLSTVISRPIRNA
jgi:uncharacterized protein (TIGR00369 family)